MEEWLMLGAAGGDAGRTWPAHIVHPTEAFEGADDGGSSAWIRMARPGLRAAL
jgi:hypothetical protein